MARKPIREFLAERRCLLQGYFRRRLRDDRDAQDLAQETYARLLRVGDDREIEDPEAYLFGVARNILTEYSLLRQRRAVREVTLDGIDIPDLASAEAVEQNLNTDQEVRLLREALQELDGPPKAVLLMHLQGMPYRAIAKVLDCHPSMVGKYMEQAIQFCRKKLSREGALV